MRRKKDLSMLYGAMAGFLMFVGLLLLCFYFWGISGSFSGRYHFPEGTQIIEQRDSHVYRDGVAVLIAQIPSESASAYAQLLRENGFADAPIPDKIYRKISNDPETGIVADVSNGLWCFADESPKDRRGEYTNYTFEVYDLDTGTYYYIQYDS